MTTKTTTFATDLLKLLLNATPIANIADNASSSALTNLYLSLHTSDPGVGGDQTTNEVSYTGYARQPIVRSNGSPAWTISSGSASPSSAVTFGTSSSAGGTATFVGLGTLVSGTGKLLHRLALSPNISCSSGVTPQLTAVSTLQET